MNLQYFNNSLSAIFSNYVVIAVLIVAFLIASYTDIKYMKIYKKFIYVFLAIRILLMIIPQYGYPLKLSHLLGAVVGSLVLLIPAMITMHKMGGDIRFIFVLGLYTGLVPIMTIIALSCVTMLIFSFIRKIITKKDLWKLNTPYLPFFFISFLILLTYNCIFI